MPQDINHQIRAVTREVKSATRDGKPTRSIVAARRFAASRDQVWEAITSAERLPQWFLPISGDLRPGGRYQLEGNAGGEILECVPPERLVVTWEWAGNISWVTIDLGEGPDGGTALRLEHAERVEEPDEFWQQYGPGGGGVGWDLALFGLDQHFASGDTIGPEQAMAWLASDEGKAFVHESSDAWGEASVAYGTDPQGAREAAARTAASYTGADPETSEA